MDDFDRASALREMDSFSELSSARGVELWSKEVQANECAGELHVVRTKYLEAER